MASSNPTWLDHVLREYHSRLLLCILASIGLVLLLVRAPFYEPVNRVGWHITHEMGNPVLSLVDVRTADEGESIPVTIQGAAGSEDAEPEAEQEPPVNEATDSAMDDIHPLDQALRIVYEDPEEMPEIEGGLTHYYLNIEYPRAALIAGIEGNLLLRFIVEPSGRAANIEVRESLHPLCDSAAVRALRRTRFVPGTQNGQRVPVRMQLPVRFEIINDPLATSSSQE